MDYTSGPHLRYIWSRIFELLPFTDVPSQEALDRLFDWQLKNANLLPLPPPSVQGHEIISNNLEG